MFSCLEDSTTLRDTQGPLAIGQAETLASFIGETPETHYYSVFIFLADPVCVCPCLWEP